MSSEKREGRYVKATMKPYVKAEDSFETLEVKSEADDEETTYVCGYFHAVGLLNRHERRAEWRTRTSRKTRMALRKIRERRLIRFATGGRDNPWR